MLNFQQVEELLLEVLDLVEGDVAEQTVGAAEDDGHLFLNGHGAILRLFEHLNVSGTLVWQL